ncbi:MAG: prenyltransferase, partial [Acidobacteriota bacterium]
MTKILKISRPRFWLYVFGPYIVGLAAGSTTPVDFLRTESIVSALYFLLPANLLIYGINDIFDYETDRLNPKKADYEILVGKETHRELLGWIIALNLPFVIAAAVFEPRTVPTLAAFLSLSIFYSAPPIRAKAIPWLDSIFNFLYIVPGIFAYQLLTGGFPAVSVLAAAGLWTAAMHAYSAIPD